MAIVVGVTGLPYVAVSSEVLQQLDLAQGALGEDLFAEDIGDLLDGYALAGLVVGSSAVDTTISMWPCSLQTPRSLPDNAIGALSQLLCHVVPLVDNEFLVEDLEDLAVREVGHGGGCGSCGCCLWLLLLLLMRRGRGTLRGGGRGSSGCSQASAWRLHTVDQAGGRLCTSRRLQQAATEVIYYRGQL